MGIINVFRSLTLVSLLFILAACGSDSTDSSSDSLAGIWVGTMEDTSSNIYTLSVSISSDNTISGISLNSANQNLTGTISQVSSNIGAKLFSFVLSDSTVGGFYADTSLTHVAYIDSTGSFGVLQRGALSLPSYLETDVAGSWSGYSVELDASLNIFREYTSSATVLADQSFTTTGNSIVSTGSFSSTDTANGLFVGTYTNTFVPAGGNVRAFLSVDKQFAATRACWNTWPLYCNFSAWTK